MARHHPSHVAALPAARPAQHAIGGLTIPADGVGGSWIVKLPSSKFQDVPENEFAMMELARAIGKHAFVIKRFDRAANGERVSDTITAIKGFRDF